MRRSTRFRRRKPSFRWFQPNIWTDGGSIGQYSTVVTGGAASASAFTTPGLTRILSGSAPFPGVVNAAGTLAGRILAERQYYRMRRIVGRLNFYLQTDKSINMEAEGGVIQVFWGIVRIPTDEQGVPDEKGAGTVIVDLRDAADQDAKEFIIAQDVWTTNYPIGTILPAGTHALAADPPLYSMIDKTMRRSARNEQDLFLWTAMSIQTLGANGIPATTDLNLGVLANLRPLGSFGR